MRCERQRALFPLSSLIECVQFYFSLPHKGLNDLYAKYGSAVSLVRPEWQARNMDDRSDTSPPGTYLLERSPELAEESVRKDEVDSLVKRFEEKMLVPHQIRFGKKASKK